MTPVKQMSEAEKEEMKKNVQQTMEKQAKEENMIIWYPSCNTCDSDKKCDDKGNTEGDARSCSDFEPDEKFGGVFLYKNRKNEAVYFKVVMGTVYVSKEKSENPLWSFPLKNLHRTSIRKQLKSKALTNLKAKDVNELVAKISLFMQQSLLMRKHNSESDLTVFLLVSPLTEEEKTKFKKKAIQWLRDPKLLVYIKKTLDIKIKRESKNKLLVFFCAHSAVLRSKEDRLHILSEAESSAGKNYLLTCVLILFPKVLDFTRISPTALDWAQVNFTGYILYLRQRRRSKKGSSNFSLNLLLSEGKLTLYVTVKDLATGRMKAIKVATIGVPAVFSTSTEEVIAEEDLTRVIDITPDSSEAKIVEVVLHQWEQAGKTNKPEFYRDEMIVRCINELMTPIDVVIPYGKKIAEYIPTEKVRVQRDNQKLIALIKTIASFYRFQRLRLKVKVPTKSLCFPLVDREVVVSNLDDLYYALHIAGDIIGKSMTNVQKRLLNFYEELPITDGFTAKEASEKTKKTYGTCAKYLKELVKKGYIKREKIEGAKNKYKYYYLENPTVSQLAKILDKIDDSFFTQEDLERWFREQNVNPKNSSYASLYRKWKGKGRIEDMKALLLDEVSINIEEDT